MPQHKVFGTINPEWSIASVRSLLRKFYVPCTTTALLVSFAAGTSAQNLGTSRQPLTIKNNVRNWTENGNVVPVCWETPGYSREKAIVRDAVSRTWEKVANIRFTGWYACPTGIGIGGSGSVREVRVRITAQDGNNAGAGGSARLGMDALSSAADNNPGVNFSFNPDGTANQGRVEYIAVHEFGHVLGFVHEQDTPGNVEGPAYCKSPGNEPNSTSLTPYDRDSIMNYCNKDGNMKGNLTDTDIRGVQAIYGLPYVGLGKVKSSSTNARPSQPICESARQARERNSPAAPGLEAQCRAAGASGDYVDINTLNALAVKGEVIANADPLTVVLRSREPVGSNRRGFDIGLAAAEGQTAPGPGKQRIYDSLSQAEQASFDTAVSFSLERNRNADLATKGAAIAQANRNVLAARSIETDVFYWLGFNIATGIFGDPALGALGNTATGPGSLKIRDSLSASGQRGFNAAVAFHLSRKYRP